MYRKLSVFVVCILVLYIQYDLTDAKKRRPKTRIGISRNRKNETRSWSGRLPRPIPVGIRSNTQPGKDKTDKLIYWGENAHREHPYMATLQMKSGSYWQYEQHWAWDENLEQCNKTWRQEHPDWFHFCGGVLIADNMVLTAAHCVDWIAGIFTEEYYDLFCSYYEDFDDCSYFYNDFYYYYYYFYTEDGKRKDRGKERRGKPDSPRRHDKDGERGDEKYHYYYNYEYDNCLDCKEFYDTYDDEYYDELRNNVRVGLGWWDLSEGEEGEGHQVYGVKNIVIHPEWLFDWDGETRTDIAVVQLDRRASGDYIEKIKLAGNKKWKKSDPCHLDGWGETQCGAPSIMQESSEKVVSKKECNMMWTVYSDLTGDNSPVYDSEICTLGENTTIPQLP